MIEKWLKAVNNGINEFISDKPTNESAVTLAALYVLKRELERETEKPAQSNKLTDNLTALTEKIKAYADDRAVYIANPTSENLQTEITDLEDFLDGLRDILYMLYSGGGVDERKIISDSLKSITAKLGG